ncbi:MAG: SusC/RagA family TonB-linked outer membrane protein [Bacteroidia bacterium]|nr:SusC/RagA family TonB-linked outer membrane protein [Bacteroidia bacterium]
MKRKLIMFLTLFFMGIGIVMAQTQVRGTVVDEQGEPAIGATIQVKGTTQGTVTDTNGNFNLSAPAGGTLIVSYVGYTTQEVPVSANVRVALKTDAELLDEVVVTGYGTTTKKAFTGAASSIGNETLKTRLDANPVKSLSGTVPGINISLGSGQPGAPATVYIRGRNSLNSGTQPLYVIDGVPFETGNFTIRGSEGVEISPLSMINSEDIESMTVLKDATATSIYGARAANGVIVITTKRGKTGFQANFTARIGTARMPYFNDAYRPATAQRYREGVVDAIDNAQKYMKNSSYFNVYENDYGHGYPNTKDGYDKWLSEWYLEIPFDEKNATQWLDEITRSGLQQNYTLDISGGGNYESAPRYFVSFDYLKDEGIILGKDLTRYSMRVNLDQAPLKFLKYGINTNLSMTESNAGSGGGYFTDPITQAYMLNPWMPVYNEDGNWNMKTNTGYNPVAIRSEHGDKNFAKQYRAIVSPYVTLVFNDWLSFTSRMGLDAYILDDFGYWSFLNSQGKDMKGMGENGYYTNFYKTMSNIFNINKSWGHHHLNALVGHEGQATNYKGAYLSGSNYPVDYLNDVTLAAKPSSASTSRRTLKLLSFHPM